jgi:hypothetical protein
MMSGRLMVSGPSQGTRNACLTHTPLHRRRTKAKLWKQPQPLIVNTVHKSRQHRQRLRLFLPANTHSTAMGLTRRNYADGGTLSKSFLRKNGEDFQPKPNLKLEIRAKLNGRRRDAKR